MVSVSITQLWLYRVKEITDKHEQTILVIVNKLSFMDKEIWISYNFYVSQNYESSLIFMNHLKYKNHC